MTSEFGLILCEGCGRLQDESYTERYSENHGPGHLETLSRTTCCRAGYTDVDGQTFVDFLSELRDLYHPATKGYVLPHPILSQVRRENIDAIIPVLEQKFDL